ncbi:MAG: SDR family oxidoreductase [Acidobacteriota bacterium]|nr:SDR family oxidoreductase [Acidobacteriota bacterium]MDQ5871152.1 SDR family oxidoreductase [Acidobacteriota bacterium]
MNRPLDGKIALVTGAGIRVGRAIAIALGNAGASVVLHCRRSREGAEAAAREIEAAGGRAVVVEGDLARPDDCRRVVRESIAALGGLDFLVHSASNFHRVSLAETDEDLWDSSMDVNARAGFLMAREAAPTLAARRGRIILVSDFLAESPARNYLAHSVSKAAVEGLVRGLAVELAPAVAVNGVAPGTVLPPEGTPAEEVERLARRVPAKRIGSANDVAETVVFLCAGPAFLTGQVIRVDGGRSIV